MEKFIFQNYFCGGLHSYSGVYCLDVHEKIDVNFALESGDINGREADA